MLFAKIFVISSCFIIYTYGLCLRRSVREKRSHDGLIYYEGHNCKEWNAPVAVIWDQFGHYNWELGEEIHFRYEVLRSIERNSMLDILECLDHKEKKKVSLVVKSLPRLNKNHLKMLQSVREKNEQEAVEMLQLIDAFFHRGFGFTVHPLVVKESLDRVLLFQEELPTLRFIRTIGKSMMKALAFFAKNDVVLNKDITRDKIYFLKGVPHSHEVLLTGFESCSHVAEAQPETYQYYPLYRPPERLMHMKWTVASDMWAMACLLIETFAKSCLICESGREMEDRPALKHLQRISILIGDANTEFLGQAQASVRSAFFYNGKIRAEPHSKEPYALVGSYSLKAFFRDTRRKIYANEVEMFEQFIDFLKKCLTWDPADRITPSDALNHPFFK